MTDVRLVLTTLPSAVVAAAIARTLVEEQLCACVNIVPGLRSIYRWEDAVHDEAEVLAIIKTTAAGYPALAARLLSLHPYDVPELLAFTAEDGHAAYLAWVAAQVR